MLIPPAAGARNTSHKLPLFRLLVLAVVLVAQAGCATTDADLDYQRDSQTPTPGDHSYHGWNSAN